VAAPAAEDARTDLPIKKHLKQLLTLLEIWFGFGVGQYRIIIVLENPK
jgi:hypothetical protein